MPLICRDLSKSKIWIIVTPFSPHLPTIEKAMCSMLSSSKKIADDIWRDFFYTELTTGLRLGEICGLRWEDFDAEHGVLKIQRTIHVEKGGVLTVGDTKTYAGTRKIVLPPSTVQCLRERKEAALTDWIFPNPLKPDLPVNPRTAYSRLKALLKDAGLPSIRFHDLRHPNVKPKTQIFSNIVKIPDH